MFGFVICLALTGDVTATNDTQQQVTHDDVDQLARHYRIQIYNLYRSQREVYDQRAETGREVLDLSSQLHRKADAQLRLAAWFNQASAAAESNEPLPPVPHVSKSEFLSVKRPEKRAARISTKPVASHTTSASAKQRVAVPADSRVRSTRSTNSKGGLLKSIGQLFLPPGPTESEDPAVLTPPITEFEDGNDLLTGTDAPGNEEEAFESEASAGDVDAEAGEEDFLE